MPELQPRIDTVLATTHRGWYYFQRYGRLDDRWTIYFHGHAGGCEALDTHSPFDLALESAQAHADAEPAHPPMRGWPAQAEMELAQ